MSFEAYISRWAAARLLSWWSFGFRWATASMLAIGRLRMQLRGDAKPLKPKLQAAIDATLEQLRLHFMSELAPCCEGEVLDVD